MVPSDFLKLREGQFVSKDDVYACVVGSKKSGSDFWGGPDWRIGNMPQQGINWIGNPPKLRAVIVKVYHGNYSEDQWIDSFCFRYALKAQKGNVDPTEKANACLLLQDAYRYPVILFIERKENYECQGAFDVDEIFESYVILTKGD